MYMCIYVQPPPVSRRSPRAIETLTFPHLGRGQTHKGGVSLCRSIDMYVHIYTTIQPRSPRAIKALSDFPEPGKRTQR